MAPPARVVLIDGTAMIYRAWYALPTNLQTSQGLTTNAVFGFATMFRKLFAGRTPTCGAVVFDAPGKTFRDAKFPAYKAQRPRMSPDLRAQLAWIDRVVAVNGFPSLRVPGFEADDVIGTLAVQAAAAGHDVQIVSADKDFAQLITEQIKMFDAIRDVTYDPELVRKKWGSPPERFIDFLALTGDKIDNVPGIPGVGNKTASRLLETYGDLEGVLAHAEELKGKLRERVVEHADQARLSRELVTIEIAVPLEVTFDQLVIVPPEPGLLNELYLELEFYSLISDEAREAVSALADDVSYSAVDSLDALANTVQWLLEGPAEPVAVAGLMDFEPPTPSPLIGLALATEPGEAFYVPFVAPEGGLGDEALELLRPWLEADDRPKVAHDAKRLELELKRRGVTLRGITFDVQLASFLIDPGHLIPHRLDQLAKEYLHRVLQAPKTVVGAGQALIRFSEAPLSAVAPFACHRVDAVRSMLQPVRERLEGAGQVEQLGRDQALSHVLADMELAGIRIDVPALDAAEADFRGRVAAAEALAFELAGHEFNLKSTKQLATVLYEELGLPVYGRTKTGYSTKQELLERLGREGHAIAQAVLEHRTFVKLINTYTEVLRAAVRPDGRIHTHLQQTTGVSGRIITTDPDLQKTPVTTPEGRRIRKAFVTDPGWSIVSADWSQIELRLLAHVSEDPLLVDSFERGVDVHARTASQLFDCDVAEVTREQRQIGKTVNFATIYGQGATALSQLLLIKRADAKAYQERYFAAYAGVTRWRDATVAEARETGYATTMLGRRRIIPELSSNDAMLRTAGERIAVNTPIQGTAADLCKLVMLQVPRRLREAGLRSRMVLQIHDELLLEAPDDEVEATSAIVRDCMESTVTLTVPLVVDVGVGANWAEAK